MEKVTIQIDFKEMLVVGIKSSITTLKGLQKHVKEIGCGNCVAKLEFIMQESIKVFEETIKELQAK